MIGLGQCSWDYLAVVDGYPAVDTKKEVLRWEEHGGGPVATALVALSRLGVGCSFFGVVGDDDAGRKIRASLVDENIDVRGLVTRRGSSSQVAFIAVEKGSGRRTIYWRKAAGEELRPDELGEGFPAGSDFLLLDGLMKDVSLFAAARAKEAGVPVMLDAGRLREGMIEAARLSDYVVASEEFARDLGWTGCPEDFRKSAEDLGSGVVTVTLGERGSVTFTGGGIMEIPAFRVEAVDTTGAGDVFHGGYIYGLLRGWNLERTIRFASAVAAMKCRRLGGRSGIPRLEEVNEFLNRREAVTGERR